MATTDTDVQNLIVNKLTYAQWKAAKAAGTLSETEAYEFTDTDTALQEKLTQGTGITISDNTVTNAGVRSIATGSANGNISVNTNGTTADVKVKGIDTAAYKAESYFQKAITDTTTIVADGTGFKVANGSIGETQLDSAVNASLDLADSALQKADITTGSANGTISVDGTNVSVYGLGTAAYKDVTSTYSDTGTDPVTGIAVKSAIDAAISSVYKPAGSVAYASLPTPAKAVEGNVYNVTDAFTTDSRFIEGAGKSYPAGTNVVIINTSGTTYKFDVLTGMVDLSNYQILITSTNKVSSDLIDDSSATNKFVTASEKTTWNNKVTANTAITGATHTKITYDSKGLVTSGTDLTASDIPDISATYQTKITSSNKISALYIDGLAAVATSNSYEDLIDKPYIPEGVIVDQTYSATSTNAQSGTAVAGAISTKQDTLVSGTNIKTINNNSILGSGNISVDSLPTQTGQSGKFLTTNGTAASWANVDALPSQSGQSGKYLTTNGSTASWGDAIETVEASLKTVNGNSLIGTGDITITSAPDLDETTINLNSNDELQAIGVIEKNAGVVKYDWVGTLAQWTAGRSGGTIPDSWICYITDDETTGVSVNPDNKSITTNSSDQIQSVGIINQNDITSAIKTWTGTLAQYNAIVTKDSNTLYNITDDDTAVAYQAYTKSETDVLLRDFLYYKSGDTYIKNYGEAINTLNLNGCLTTSKQDVFFSLVVPKRLDNISTITVNSIVGGVRGADGGYIISLGTDFSTVSTVSAVKVTENYIGFQLRLNTASTLTNNITTNVMIYSMSLSFS